MSLKDYYHRQHDEIRVAPEQASRFAKQVAGDFNPLHDPDAKRFCVPGDLLFALVLSRYGLNQHMHFVFAGMVGDGVALQFPDSDAAELSIADDKDKEYLHVTRSGAHSTNPALIEALSHAYVAFSGQTFPHILVPLMSKHNTMINPERPLVIYESMTIDLDRLDIAQPQLELSQAHLEVKGKRGDVRLEFHLSENGSSVGRGEKRMVLSGLRDYDAEQVQTMVDGYAARKQAYGG